MKKLHLFVIGLLAIQSSCEGLQDDEVEDLRNKNGDLESMDKAEFLAQVREEAMTKRTTRFGRGGVPKNRLLDDGDQNIGNAVVISRQPLVNGSDATIIPATTEPFYQRILALDALSPTGQMVTLTFTASLFTPNRFLGIGIGNITGIVEFGNGSQFTRLEVDIPVGPYQVTTTAFQPQDSGVTITLPAGTLRAFARHDGGYVTPTVGNVAALPNPTPVGLNDNPVLVKAFATYFTRATTKAPTKTIFTGGILATPPNGGVIFAIPPFAKKVRPLRGTSLADYTIRFYDSFGGAVLGVNTFAGAAGTLSAFVDIPGTASEIYVEASIASSFFGFEFEIGI